MRRAGVGLLVLGALALLPPNFASADSLIPVGCVIDPATPGCTEEPHLDNPLGIAISPDGKSLYLSSDHGVNHFSRDPATGLVTYVGCAGDPAFGCTEGLLPGKTHALTLSPDGRSLYALGVDSEVTTFVAHLDRDPDTGVLTPRGCIGSTSTASQPCPTTAYGIQQADQIIVSPDGRSAYVASDDGYGQYPGDNALVGFSRDRVSGQLEPTGQCFQPIAFGNKRRCVHKRGMWNLSNLVMSPDGKSLYGVAIESGSVQHFRRAKKTGKLKPAGCLEDDLGPFRECHRETPQLVAPESLAISPNGRSIYAAGEVLTHLVRRKDGSLRATGCVKDRDYAPDSQACDSTADAVEVWWTNAVAASPDGGSVYVVDGLSNAIGAFRQSKRGDLVAAGCVGLEGDPANVCGSGMGGLDSPWSLAVSPDGRFVYVVSRNAHYESLAILERS